MLKAKAEEGTAAKTLREYDLVYKKYYQSEPVFKKSINDIQFSDYKAFFRRIIVQDGLTKKTFKNVVVIANNVINYAINKDIMSLNPIRDIIKCDFPYKPEPAYNSIKAKALTPAQIEKVQEWAEQEYRNQKKVNMYAEALIFNLEAGLRFAELTGLKWSDYDPEERSLTVQKQNVLMYKMEEDGSFSAIGRREKDSLKSNEEPRKLYVSDKMAEILQKRKEKENGEYIFPLRYHTYSAKIKDAAKYAGIESMEQIRTHSIRTTAATTLYNNCHDVRTVQALLGHTTTEMTQKYIKNIDNFERLKAAMS